MINDLHKTDFYEWTKQTVNALKTGDIMALDFESLIEEIEDLGASKERELNSRLTILLAHLLKWQFQPSYRAWDISGKSWTLTIEEQREQIKWLMEENPSLKSKLDRCFLKGYKSAILRASKETNLEKSAFPTECPYTWEQIINDDFYPE